MKSKKTILIRLIALAAVIALAVVLFIIGRGHTIYFDNKALEVGGKSYSPYYKVEVFVNDESVAKLGEGDRGMTTTMGQKFSMVLHITPAKGEKKYGKIASLDLPYNLDGIIVNIPALLEGAEQSEYMEEFVPAADTSDDEEVVITEEFEMPMGDE